VNFLIVTAHMVEIKDKGPFNWLFLSCPVCSIKFFVVTVISCSLNVTVDLNDQEFLACSFYKEAY